MNTTIDQKDHYQFILSGEKNQYSVSFTIIGTQIDSSCSCASGKEEKLCWHRQYILAGKTSRITGGDYGRQKELLVKATSFKQGLQLIASAKKKFEGDTNCKRCGSSRIVRIKTSPMAWLYCLLKEHSHTYFCKDCKWTW